MAITEVQHHSRSSTPSRTSPDWAAGATGRERPEWSRTASLDPGDSHDKGELSLCVGEAA